MYQDSKMIILEHLNITRLKILIFRTSFSKEKPIVGIICIAHPMENSIHYILIQNKIGRSSENDAVLYENGGTKKIDNLTHL